MAFKMKSPMNFFGNLTRGLAGSMSQRGGSEINPDPRQAQMSQTKSPIMSGGIQPPIMTQAPLLKKKKHNGGE